MTSLFIEDPSKIDSQGGLSFFLYLLPYLSKKFDIKIYGPGRFNGSFDYKGAEIIVKRSVKLPWQGKGILRNIGYSPEFVLFLEYVAALSKNDGKRNAMVFHHSARSFFNENPQAYRELFGFSGDIYLRMEPILLRTVAKKVRHVLEVSNISGRFLESLGFSPILVGNGIPVQKYFARKKEDYAVYVGRLVNYKRVELAIKTADLLDMDLYVIGEGPERSYLEKLAGKRTHFTGYLSEKDKIALLSRAKYLFNFSVFEGFNITLLEAMASKAVPIVFDNLAHRFVFSGEKVGYLVKSISEAVEAVRYLEENEGERKKMAEMGRKLVEKNWDAKVIADRYANAINEILSGE